MCKGVKVIIYLNNVDYLNGPLKIVYPEIECELNWFKEKTSGVPRTSETDILKHYNKNNIISVEGSKYTCIIFEGSATHSGGYVIKGHRHSIYMEFY